MGTDIYSFHIYNKNFSPLWTTHNYLVFTIFDIKLYISIRFYSATYYFQWNPLLLSLLNIRLKEMVWHVKDIFECYQKLILLAHIFIRRKYLRKLKGIGDRELLQKNKWKSQKYHKKTYRNSKEGKSIGEREPPQRNQLKPRKLSVLLKISFICCWTRICAVFVMTIYLKIK